MLPYHSHRPDLADRFNLVFIKTFELSESPVWRWSLLAVLLGGGLAVLAVLRRDQCADSAIDRPIAWDLLVCLLFIHLFSLVAYVLVPSARPSPSWLAVWLIVTAVTVAIVLAPARRYRPHQVKSSSSRSSPTG